MLSKDVIERCAAGKGREGGCGSSREYGGTDSGGDLVRTVSYRGRYRATGSLPLSGDCIRINTQCYITFEPSLVLKTHSSNSNCRAGSQLDKQVTWSLSYTTLTQVQPKSFLKNPFFRAGGERMYVPSDSMANIRSPSGLPDGLLLTSPFTCIMRIMRNLAVLCASSPLIARLPVTRIC